MGASLRLLAVLGACGMLFAHSAMALSKQDSNLIYQANFGSSAKVAALLKAGANPNATGDDKWPALSLAVLRSDDESLPIIKLLVEGGADINIRDANGETPLMNAITVNNAEMVRYMLENGSDFNATSAGGRNVLSFAMHYGNDEISGMVKEAMSAEQARIREGSSASYMYRILDEYVYNHCAVQYIAYNNATGLYTAEQAAHVNTMKEDMYNKLGSVQIELQHNFRLDEKDFTYIATNVQKMIFQQLEALISNRNRLSHNVGKDADMKKRCDAVVAAYRGNYAEYEQKAKAR